MHEGCGDWLPELSVAVPEELRPARGWRRAKFASVPSRPGGLTKDQGRARESGIRNGHRISPISVIISYGVNKGREERRVTKQTGRYLALPNA